MSGKYYGVKLTDDLEEEMEQIETFVNEGVPVVIVDDLTDLEELGINGDVEMIEAEQPYQCTDFSGWSFLNGL